MKGLLVVCTVILFALTSTSCSNRSAPPAPLSDSELDSRAKALVSLLSQGKYQDAVKMMDRTMASVMPADKLKAAWDSVTSPSQAGTFGSVKGTRVAQESGYRVVYVTCSFSAATLDIKVVFDSAGLVSGLWFVPSTSEKPEYKPPSYADASKFTEVECTIGEGAWKLPAILTMPVLDRPSAAVVLVHGSGPQDRDESIGPNKPFKDLAWGLASRGIAALRYEKRTKQYPKEVQASLDTFTVDQETVDDAVAALRYLAGVPSIDPKRIFIAGHSLGGYLAPKIAQAATRTGAPLAGLIMLAPSARDTLDLVVEQTRYIAALDGKIDEAEDKAIKDIEAAVGKIRQGGLKPGEVVLGGSKSYWDSLSGYDATATLAGLDLPVLLLQGERDYQVTMTDYGIWKQALQAKAGATLKSFPGLNHLFMRGEGPPSPAEYERPSNVDIDVIQAIAAWIGDR